MTKMKNKKFPENKLDCLQSLEIRLVSNFTQKSFWKRNDLDLDNDTKFYMTFYT